MNLATLKDQVGPISCYTAEITVDGKTVRVNHICSDPNCPGLS